MAKMINGELPIYSQFGEDIYASDVVQQALYTVVTEIKKLNPRHIKKQGLDVLPSTDRSIQRVLDYPNELMTKSDMLEKITWQVLLNNNAFIYIERDRVTERITGLYPLNPSMITFLEGNRGMYVEMGFKNGDKYTLPYKSLIHIKTHYYKSDLMGGDENGRADNKGLLKTLQLNDILLQGIKKSLQSSFAINGIIKYNTLLDDGRLDERIKEFEQKIQNSTSGLLALDTKADIMQFNRQLKVVDATTLNFIDDKILRHFGVPSCIVSGKYTNEEYRAFYQKTLEPLIINFSEAFTKKIFTEREQTSFDNKIYFYPKELVLMSVSETLEMIKALSPTGTLFENEKRFAFGLEPHADLVGKRLQSLNFVDVDIAREYQLKGVLPTDNKIKEEGEEDDGNKEL